MSFAPPKTGTDIENNMVYSADMGIGKVAGIKLDQATGEMKTVFVVDAMTNAVPAADRPQGQAGAAPLEHETQPRDRAADAGADDRQL